MFTLELPEQEWPPLLLFPLSKPQQFAPCILQPFANCKVLFATCKLLGFFGLLSRFAASNRSLSFPLLFAIENCKPFLLYFFEIASICKLQGFFRVLFAIATCRPILGCYPDLQLAIIPSPFLYFLLLKFARLFYSTFLHLLAFANYRAFLRCFLQLQLAGRPWGIIRICN